MQQDEKEEIKNFLEEHRLMVIATQGEHPWAATVYYVADDDLNLYFVSPPSSRHVVQLKQSPEVACAIADSSQRVNDKKRGLQLYGEAKEETGLETIRWMLSLFNKLHPSTAEKLNFKNFQAKTMTSHVYKVIPKEIKLFDESHDDTNPERTFSIS